MEISLLKALLSNISSFLNLSSFEKINSEPVQKYYQRAEEILKLLKPILNAIIDSEVTSDEVFIKAFEGLGLSIQELREQCDSWQPLLSKVYFHCLQKIKHVGYEQTSSVIREAIRDQVDSVGPSSEILAKIAENLSLGSNQEILIEAVALEKLKENA
ncbi:hypothetical protein Goari_014394, partial [Gossypium aridum]|nr:hypothetical protein [Gossypium aridum]